MYTNMEKKVTREFKSGGLHERHVVDIYFLKKLNFCENQTNSTNKFCGRNTALFGTKSVLHIATPPLMFLRVFSRAVEVN